MKKFWVDFSGYGWVEAETEQEAEAKFWQFVETRANNNGILCDDVWDVEGIEEKPDEPGETTARAWEDFWYDK